jgi:hypothetical protein
MSSCLNKFPLRYCDTVADLPVDTVTRLVSVTKLVQRNFLRRKSFKVEYTVFLFSSILESDDCHFTSWQVTALQIRTDMFKC